MRNRAKPLFIRPTATVKESIALLDRTGERILLATKKDGTLLGTLTDGDIRRYLLRSGDLTATIEEVFNPSPITLGTDYTVPQARRLMLERSIDKIPVIDAKRRVVDLLAWHEVFADGREEPRTPIDVPVVIMAGGRGNRLDPFTRILPKPLIPVEDKPIIQAIMDRFIEHGAKRFLLTLNYKAAMIKAYFEGADEAAPGCRIDYVEEREPLGTAGSLALLPADVKGPFFLTNCDILVRADYAEVLRHHREQGNLITMVASMQHFRVPYGVVELDEEGGLARILEKPEYDLLANTGMYVLDRKVSKHFPSKAAFDMTELMESVRAAGGRVGVFPVTQGAWVDVGQWAEYFRNAVGPRASTPPGLAEEPR